MILNEFSRYITKLPNFLRARQHIFQTLNKFQGGITLARELVNWNQIRTWPVTGIPWSTDEQTWRKALVSTAVLEIESVINNFFPILSAAKKEGQRNQVSNELSTNVISHGQWHRYKVSITCWMEYISYRPSVLTSGDSLWNKGIICRLFPPDKRG